MYKENVANSRIVAIIFGIGLSVYLIYCYHAVSNVGISTLTPQQSHSQLPHVDFPMLVDSNTTDKYWQVMTTSNGTFYLFNAYYDDREDFAVVRVLALIDKIDSVVSTHCQLWYTNTSDAVISEVHEYKSLWPSYWGQNTKGATPFLISCRSPHRHAPKFVSLTEHQCDKANNLMAVKNKRPSAGQRKKLFLVTVKGLDFADDVSLLLVEWCEILKILGVDRVEIFIVNAHINVMRVLRYYQSRGLVTIKFLKYPHNLPNKRSESWHQWSQNDLVPYHDSFYENLYSYEYTVPMDIDELIIPVRPEDGTWRDLMTRTLERARRDKKDFDSLAVVNRYFLLKSVHENETIEGIPKGLRFLSNIYRAANFTPGGGNAKSFMRTDRVRVLHNHFPNDCIGGCRSFEVSPADGHLFHYRTDCENPECKESKANPTRDVTLWKFKDEILDGVNRTLEKLRDYKSDLEGDVIKL